MISRSKATIAVKAAAAAKNRQVSLKNGDITVKVSESGALEPVTQVEVKSKVAGRVQRIYVKEGDTVQAGAPLAVIDPTEVKRQVDQIKAQLASARAGLKQSEENYDLTRTQSTLAIRRAEAALTEAKLHLVQTAAPARDQDVAQAEQAVARADAQVADAKRTQDRKKALVEKGFIAQSEADSAQVAVTLAETDAASAREHLSLLKAGARKEDIDSARAAVASAEIALATEKANAAQSQLRLRDIERARGDVAQIENQLAVQNVSLGDTGIVAPIGGQVIGKYVEEGELVASATAGFAQGATLVKIADLSHMQVRVNINEVDVARIHVGLPVEIRIDGVPNKVFSGQVAAIAPSSLGDKPGSNGQSGGGSQGGVVRFEVKVAVTTPDPRLRPGMTAAVDIVLDRRKNVPLLPAEALQTGDTVTVVTPGKAGAPDVRKSRKVTVGLRDDAHVEIRDGLKPDEKVEIPKIEASDRRKVNFD